MPGSLEALNTLTHHGFSLIVITNQSIINRGMVTLEVLTDIHDRLKQAVARTGGKITDIFFCPHRPDEHCACRKPEPGLIARACGQYNIRVADSIMIGDNAKDIEAGRRAGCARTILVRTGNGRNALADLKSSHRAPDSVADDLLHAARLIVAGESGRGA